MIHQALNDSHHSNLRRIAPSTIECHLYQTSRCPKGNLCKFSHRGKPKGYCSNSCPSCLRDKSKKRNDQSSNHSLKSGIFDLFNNFMPERINTNRSQDNQRSPHIVIRIQDGNTSPNNLFPFPFIPFAEFQHRGTDASYQNFETPANTNHETELNENDWIDEDSLFTNPALITEYVENMIQNAKKSEETKPQREPELVLEEEADPDKACVVCMRYKKDHAFDPCGHKVICGSCALNKDKLDGKCVVCRKNFRNIMKIYE